LAHSPDGPLRLAAHEQHEGLPVLGIDLKDRIGCVFQQLRGFLGLNAPGAQVVREVVVVIATRTGQVQRGVD
jgi:hypothetical protein